MNRLLLRSLPTAEQPVRIEVLFSYVQYMRIGMDFDGLSIYNEGPVDPLGFERWKVDQFTGLSRYGMSSLSGDGYLIAANASVRSGISSQITVSAFFEID
jgi:hypothetical protein